MGSGLDTAGRSEGMNVTFRIDGEVAGDGLLQPCMT